MSIALNNITKTTHTDCISRTSLKHVRCVLYGKHYGGYARLTLASVKRMLIHVNLPMSKPERYRMKLSKFRITRFSF